MGGIEYTFKGDNLPKGNCYTLYKDNSVNGTISRVVFIKSVSRNIFRLGVLIRFQ